MRRATFRIVRASTVGSRSRWLAFDGLERGFYNPARDSSCRPFHSSRAPHGPL